MSPGFLDHLLALILIVVFPVRAKLFGYQRLLDARPADLPDRRRWLYRQAMRIQWALTLFLLVIWIGRARPLSALGLTARPELAFFLVQAGAILIAGILFWQARRISRSEQALERVGPKLDRMRLMLPHTDEELRRFLWLSLTAGICEELLYRGFLLAYFGHWLGPIPSLVISSAIFGLGHSYQGARGVLLTGFVGAILGVFYMLSGSLFPSMLLHAGGDMYSGWIAHAALSRERLKPPVTSPAYDLPPTP